ncbi:hypothetical protein DHEL01_v211344 [Diaporthe helianthi]|uniref:2EXR domain-containing protein n=1 Tax=Diaporthe helianthi TaxID=158607 RepID=A0A2P5HJ70_DIAHE|nr:hypothetical protein DHEL01_v211344 [Diaporthe helianthi]
MSFLSFLSSLLPSGFVANNNTEPDGVDAMDPSDGFPAFPRLPAELRHMIIKEALYDHEQEIHRVVLFDPVTRGISPTKELATMASPLLFVNAEARSLALKVYCKIDVFGIRAPEDDEFGDESEWYIVPWLREYLFYSQFIAQQIHGVGDEIKENKGCLYINPERDTFVTGITPRQVAHTTVFRSLPAETNPPWKIPRDFITDELQEDTLAKITTIRELEWDLDDRCMSCGSCFHCGRKHRVCCTENFFDDDDGRGAEWRPLFRASVFTGVKSFGFYLMVSPDDMQQFLSDMVRMGGKACLEEEWSKRYLEFDLARLGQ